MSFELLDNILEESGVDGIYSNKEKDTDVGDTGLEEGDEIYADLDEMIEAGMRETLKNTITESAVPAETKLQHLAIVENAEFDKDQMTTFMDETIHPILTFSEVIDEDVDIDNAVVVSLPLYELAMVLAAADNGMLEEESEEGETSGYDAFTEAVLNDKTKKDNTGEVEINEEALTEALDEVLETYDIPEEDRETMLDEAIELYTNTPDDVDIIPSIQEVAECVSIYNSIAEGDDPSAFELAEAYLEEKKGLGLLVKKSKKALGKKLTTGKKLVGKKAKVAEKEIAKKVKASKKYLGKKYKVAKKTTVKMTKQVRKALKGKGKIVGAAALGAAALGTAATLAYKKRKAMGADDKQSATAAIAAIKGQMSKCTTDKCRASAQKQIAKWQARM